MNNQTEQVLSEYLTLVTGYSSIVRMKYMIDALQNYQLPSIQEPTQYSFDMLNDMLNKVDLVHSDSTSPDIIECIEKLNETAVHLQNTIVDLITKI